MVCKFFIQWQGAQFNGRNLRDRANRDVRQFRNRDTSRRATGATGAAGCVHSDRDLTRRGASFVIRNCIFEDNRPCAGCADGRNLSTCIADGHIATRNRSSSANPRMDITAAATTRVAVHSCCRTCDNSWRCGSWADSRCWPNIQMYWAGKPATRWSDDARIYGFGSNGYIVIICLSIRKSIYIAEGIGLGAVVFHRPSATIIDDRADFGAQIPCSGITGRGRRTLPLRVNVRDHTFVCFYGNILSGCATRTCHSIAQRESTITQILGVDGNGGRVGV